MEVYSINATIGLGSRLPSAERMSTRIINNRDTNGDNQLSATEFYRNEQTFNRIDSDNDNLVSRQELLTALSERLAERTGTGAEVSFSINIIKARLGTLVADILRSSGDSGETLLAGQANGAVANDRAEINARQRYISSYFTAAIDDDLFGGTSGLDGSSPLNLFGINGNDGRDVLLSLLTDELQTSQAEAESVLELLQNTTLELFA